jgi:hypothetical protein
MLKTKLSIDVVCVELLPYDYKLYQLLSLLLNKSYRKMSRLPGAIEVEVMSARQTPYGGVHQKECHTLSRGALEI